MIIDVRRRVNLCLYSVFVCVYAYGRACMNMLVHMSCVHVYIHTSMEVMQSFVEPISANANMTHAGSKSVYVSRILLHHPISKRMDNNA